MHETENSSAHQHNSPLTDSVPTEVLPSISHFNRRADPQHTSSVSSGDDNFVPLSDASSSHVDIQIREHNGTSNTTSTHNHHLHTMHPQDLEVPSLRKSPMQQEIRYTSDCRIKVTEIVRRRCFKCGATKGSAWRRSLANPGKIVCNKCGLRERVRTICRRGATMLGSTTTSAPPAPQARLPHLNPHSSYRHGYALPSSGTEEGRQEYPPPQISVPFVNRPGSYEERAAPFEYHDLAS
ncbi:hypothetical protein AB1N83_011940 [Pleurotus pulmonarius]